MQFSCWGGVIHSFIHSFISKYFRLQLCLLSKNLKPALQFLDSDITDLSREVLFLLPTH